MIHTEKIDAILSHDGTILNIEDVPCNEIIACLTKEEAESFLIHLTEQVDKMK